MEGYFFLGICWLILQDPLWVQSRTPGTKSGLTEEAIRGTTLVPTETTQTLADRCRGYYDVMGQWDPPFNCNASSYLYCCGTCGYRFCCQFKHGRLDQSTCSNYDTPNWANTGKPISQGEDATDDPSKDKSNMIVYIICGVAALMVLVGIFTKLAVEKTQSSAHDLNISRTLTDLLKQPANADFVNDGHRGSVQVQITEVMQGISPRNSIDHTNFSSLGMTSPLTRHTGLPLTHNDQSQLVPSISLQGQDFSKYATMKTVEHTNEDFYKRFQAVDVFGPSNNYQLGGLHAQESSSLPSSHIFPKSNHKVKIAKTNTHPLFGAGFQVWDTSHHDVQPHVYANKRQYSIEKLPELFSQQGHYVKKPKCHFSSNMKTEVTV